MGRKVKETRMKVLKNNEGRYFVEGRGFSARTPGEATSYADSAVQAAVARITSVGLPTPAVEDGLSAEDAANIIQNPDGSSFAVYFVRKNQVRSDGTVVAHRNNPSKRRFRTEDEAIHHGNRFVKVEKHAGFWIQKRTEPVNAYVNKVTGKTNPVIGRARTNR